MAVDDFCRLCKECLRTNGILTNTKKIFESNKLSNEKSVDERLAALGLTLSKDNSKSGRVCRACFRLVGRIEDGFAIFRKWQEAERETSPESSASTLRVEGSQEVLNICIQDSEPTPPTTQVCVPNDGATPPTPIWTPPRKLFRPAPAPARLSQTEVIIRYPSRPKGDRIICKASTSGIVENIAKENWRTASNLIVRHTELFGQLKENMLQVIEDESKTLCNPYKGFMLWQSSAANLKAFSFASLQADLQRMSPFIFSIFYQITKQSANSTCASAAIALRAREPRLSAFAYYVDSVLRCGGARKAVFKRLSKLGITTSHTCALRKHKQLANTGSEDHQLLRVDKEIFHNPRMHEGDADGAEDGSAFQRVGNTNLMASQTAEVDVLIVDSDYEEEVDFDDEKVNSDYEEPSTSSFMEIATDTGAAHKRKLQDAETGEASAKRHLEDQSAATIGDDDHDDNDNNGDVSAPD